MTDELPVPTTDVARAREDLERSGYCVLAEVARPDLLAAIRERVIEQAAGERKLGVGIDDGVEPERYISGSGRGERNNRRVWTLVNKGAVFRRLLTHPDVNHLIGGLLGTPFLLSSIQANFVSPGDDPLPLHSDQGYVMRPWPSYPLTASVIWMIDEFTENNGATSVVPGTHIDRPGNDARSAVNRARLIRQGGIAVRAPAGSALVFDGRVVHGTGRNTTDQARIGILTYFCRAFVRQQENFTLSVAPEVLSTLSGEVKALLGFEVWKTLGSVEGVCAEGALVDRPAAWLASVDRSGRPCVRNGDVDVAVP
jgi:ectoine hydroxylase-related dioxygenase (phytanoyl-CoA dioxygenase family)